jgi:hypothetical protein
LKQAKYSSSQLQFIHSRPKTATKHKIEVNF